MRAVALRKAACGPHCPHRPVSSRLPLVLRADVGIGPYERQCRTNVNCPSKERQRKQEQGPCDDCPVMRRANSRGGKAARIAQPMPAPNAETCKFPGRHLSMSASPNFPHGTWGKLGQNIFSFPPCTAHFLFDVSRRKWGVHSGAAKSRKLTPPARQGGYPKLSKNRRTSLCK